MSALNHKWRWSALNWAKISLGAEHGNLHGSLELQQRNNASMPSEDVTSASESARLTWL